MVHGSVPDDPDGPDVRRALSRLHGTDTTRWELVATYDLPHALPGMPAPHPMRKPVRVCGHDGDRLRRGRPPGHQLASRVRSSPDAAPPVPCSPT